MTCPDFAYYLHGLSRLVTAASEVALCFCGLDLVFDFEYTKRPWQIVVVVVAVIWLLADLN